MSSMHPRDKMGRFVKKDEVYDYEQHDLPPAPKLSVYADVSRQKLLAIKTEIERKAMADGHRALKEGTGAVEALAQYAVAYERILKSLEAM